MWLSVYAKTRDLMCEKLNKLGLGENVQLVSGGANERVVAYWFDAEEGKRRKAEAEAKEQASKAAQDAAAKAKAEDKPVQAEPPAAEVQTEPEPAPAVQPLPATKTTKKVLKKKTGK